MTPFTKDDLNRIPEATNQKLKLIGQSAYSVFSTVQHSYLSAKNIIERNVPGCIVECGVANGSQVGAMALAQQELSVWRANVLYDSFEGIPLAGPNDHDQPGIGTITHNVSLPLEQRLKTSGVSAASVEQVQFNLARWGFDPDYFSFNKGWFQHTLPDNQIGSIALLRLDGDLYESTDCCLRALGSKVSKGGIIIIDDYPLPGCRKAVDEYLEMNKLNPDIHIVPDSTVAYWFA